MGPARVIEITHPREITADELRGHSLRAGERVLFRTSNSARCWQTDRFVEDFVYISEQAADYLAETRVRTVGIDYLSVGGYHADGAKIHRTLLDGGHLDHRGPGPFRRRGGPVRNDLPPGQAARQ